jgi:hypothetical protein
MIKSTKRIFCVSSRLSENAGDVAYASGQANGGVLPGKLVSWLDDVKDVLRPIDCQVVFSDDVTWNAGYDQFDREYEKMFGSNRWVSAASTRIRDTLDDLLHAVGQGCLKVLPRQVGFWLESVRDALDPVEFQVIFSEEECDPAIKSRQI